mmetsp:Transcript_65458/g.75280  ORF Transcript_65458/g.75280 Transcript_65458/m.75280 type:complete len:291 (-) Transcript_65458:122-994(-)
MVKSLKFSLLLSSVLLITVTNGLTCDDWKSQGDQTTSDWGPLYIESPHPYCDNMDITQSYTWSEPMITVLRLRFDDSSEIENAFDFLTIKYTDEDGNEVENKMTGTVFPDLDIPGNSFVLNFKSDPWTIKHGFKISVYPKTRCDDWSQGEWEQSFEGTAPQVIESPHPYCNNLSIPRTYSWTDSSITGLRLDFDTASEIEEHYDTLHLVYHDETGEEIVIELVSSGFPSVDIPDETFYLEFNSDPWTIKYGFKLTVTPQVGTSFHDEGKPIKTTSFLKKNKLAKRLRQQK